MGGQSIPNFDYYMAPGVAKSFIKNVYKTLDIRYPECAAGESDTIDDKLVENEGVAIANVQDFLQVSGVKESQTSQIMAIITNILH